MAVRAAALLPQLRVSALPLFQRLLGGLQSMHGMAARDAWWYTWHSQEIECNGHGPRPVLAVNCLLHVRNGCRHS